MSRGYAMCTLIKNMHLIFCDSIPRSPRRWVTATEALLLQGFPVHPEFPGPPLGERNFTSFNTHILRAPRKVCERAGNSMNVNCIGFVFWYVLVHFSPRDNDCDFLGALSYLRGNVARKRRRLNGKVGSHA